MHIWSEKVFKIMQICMNKKRSSVMYNAYVRMCGCEGGADLPLRCDPAARDSQPDQPGGEAHQSGQSH